MLKVFSTFSGVGGMDLPFHDSFMDFDVVGFSEIDPNASAVLKYHHPRTVNYGDISKIKSEELPYFDILCGGSPCTDVSMAGRRQGLSGKRSGLFFEYIRILQECLPTYFVFENVGGMFSSNGGWDFARVQTEFSKAGYSFRWEYLNAVGFGVPQKRERIFIFGVRNDSSRRQILSFSAGDEQNTKYTKKPKLIGAMPLKGYDTKYNNNYRVYDENETSPCLNGYAASNPSIIQIPRGNNKGGEFKESSPTISANSFSHNNFLVVKDMNVIRELPEGRSNCISANYFKGPDNHGERTLVAHSSSGRQGYREERISLDAANTLTTGDGCRAQSSQNLVLEDDVKIRRLTPEECETLMSWPRGWTKYGTYGNGKTRILSDSARYKAIGNGVVSACVEPIRDLILMAETLYG